MEISNKARNIVRLARSPEAEVSPDPRTYGEQRISNILLCLKG